MIELYGGTRTIPCHAAVVVMNASETAPTEDSFRAAHARDQMRSINVASFASRKSQLLYRIGYKNTLRNRMHQHATMPMGLLRVELQIQGRPICHLSSRNTTTPVIRITRFRLGYQ